MTTEKLVLVECDSWSPWKKKQFGQKSAAHVHVDATCNSDSSLYINNCSHGGRGERDPISLYCTRYDPRQYTGLVPATERDIERAASNSESKKWILNNGLPRSFACLGVNLALGWCLPNTDEVLLQVWVSASEKRTNFLWSEVLYITRIGLLGQWPPVLLARLIRFVLFSRLRPWKPLTLDPVQTSAWTRPLEPFRIIF